jgi:DNA-binding transcriptional LysR family regulator
MRFEISPLDDSLIEALQRGHADLLITIDTAISTELPSAPLYQEDYVVVGWTGNRALAGPMTKDLYEELGHVTVKFGRSRVPSFEEWAIKSQSVSRRVEIVSPNFTAVGGFLVGSQRIATMHRRLAERMARWLPLRLMEVPFEIPPIRQAAQWAPASDNDPAIAWLVERLRQIVASEGF